MTDDHESYHQLWHHPENRRAFHDALLTGTAIAWWFITVISITKSAALSAALSAVAAVGFTIARIGRHLQRGQANDSHDDDGHVRSLAVRTVDDA